MGRIFTITPDIKAVIQDAIDDLLTNGEQGGLGKTCILVYPPKNVRCTNCIIDPTTGRSVGRYRHGGPRPFQNSKCPLCQGEALKSEVVSEEITLLCNWQPKHFTIPIKNLDLREVSEGSLLETKGYVVDIPKILKAQYLIYNEPVSPYSKQTFKLKVEPSDRSNIVQGRYFYCLWERVSV